MKNNFFFTRPKGLITNLDNSGYQAYRAALITLHSTVIALHSSVVTSDARSSHQAIIE